MDVKVALSMVIGIAESFNEDLATGLEDGTYTEGDPDANAVAIEVAKQHLTGLADDATIGQEAADLILAINMGFEVNPDPDQGGMFYFVDPGGSGSDISFATEHEAWKQVIVELPSYIEAAS
jgi:hypothetical protein